MKKCPFCAEEIQYEALKCKHCGEFLDGRTGSVLPTTQATAQPWYFKTSILLTLFLCVGPLALPLLWFNPKFKQNFKITMTVVVLLATYFLAQLMSKSVESILNYNQQLQSVLSS